jgi:hypothetical protein
MLVNHGARDLVFLLAFNRVVAPGSVAGGPLLAVLSFASVLVLGRLVRPDHSKGACT